MPNKHCSLALHPLSRTEGVKRQEYTYSNIATHLHHQTCESAPFKTLKVFLFSRRCLSSSNVYLKADNKACSIRPLTQSMFNVCTVDTQEKCTKAQLSTLACSCLQFWSNMSIVSHQCLCPVMHQWGSTQRKHFDVSSVLL